ncbi:MAG: bacteriohemerythrin [Magnetococcales bacterium]|nr:bacteriohemerythrin [Magnetococcales bacterium]MBF0322397.1 bacteriohemerythrin [Magnetococcales bacterium]
MSLSFTMEHLVDFLSQSSAFKSLPPSLLNRLIVPILGITHFAPGERIGGTEEKHTNVHLVYRGRVHGMRKTESGREHHFFISEGEMFGEMALVSEEENHCELKAVVSTICITLELETLKEAMANHWQLAKTVFVQIGQRLAERMAPMRINRYPWSDIYKVGLTKIDAQHGKLFKLVNALGDCLESQKEDDGPDQKIQEILRELLLYVDTHFRDEEELMAGVQAPWLDEHKKMHQKLAADITDFNHKIKQAASPADQRYMLVQLHGFMGDLLATHIIREDMKLGKFLANRS